MKTIAIERHVIGEVRRAAAHTAPTLAETHYAKAAGWAIKAVRITGETVGELCVRLRISATDRDAMIHASKKLGTDGSMPKKDRLAAIEYRLTRLERDSHKPYDFTELDDRVGGMAKVVTDLIERLEAAEAKLAVLYLDPATLATTPLEEDFNGQ